MEKKNIMIVEDEAVVAHDIQNCLEKAGFRVAASVSSGKKAVEAASTATVDLVLMDIRLLGSMDGIEAAEAISRIVDVPVVYLTAYSDEAILERAKLTEPFGYLVKPFDRRELESTIKMAIYKHEKLTERFNTSAVHNRSDPTDSGAAEDGESSERTELGFGFEYASTNGTLLYYGKEVILTKKQYRFIELLVENLDRTVTYEKIDSYVWGGIGVDSNNMRIFLWRLRSKVGKELIKNTLGLGYKIEEPPLR